MKNTEKKFRLAVRKEIKRIFEADTKDPFVPKYGTGEVVHDCPKHVQEVKSGKKGKVVNHSLNESGEVNFVDVDFGTGKIFENIPTKKLKVLESHVHEHVVKEEPISEAELTEAPMDKRFENEWVKNSKILLTHLMHELRKGPKGQTRAQLQLYAKQIAVALEVPEKMGKIVGMQETIDMDKVFMKGRKKKRTTDESNVNEISVEKGLDKVDYDNPVLDGIKITGVLAWDIQQWMKSQPDARKLNKGRFRDLVPILHKRGFAKQIHGANLRNWQAVVKKHIKESKLNEGVGGVVTTKPFGSLNENSYYDLKKQYYEIADNHGHGGLLSTLQDIKKKADTDQFDKIGGIDSEIKIWTAIHKLVNRSKLGKIL